MKREKVIDMADFVKQSKFTAWKRKARRGLINTRDWIWENKELVIFFTPIVIGAITTGTRVIGKHINLRKEEKLKNLYCYDRSLGHYWSLRRELTNKEWVTIDKRKQNGERLADILSELKVLK